MAQKANIYKEKDVIIGSELLDQLKEAVVELEDRMKTSITIYKYDVPSGFGVSKAQKSIAADSVISIVRAIKALKGW